jgi:hypothetical protein
MRLKLNLVVIILLDEHYGMVQWKQRNRNLSEFGLAFGNPDFVKYAEAYRFFQHVELDGAMTARGTTPAKNNAIKIRVASNARMTSTRLALTFGRGASVARRRRTRLVVDMKSDFAIGSAIVNDAAEHITARCPLAARFVACPAVSPRQSYSNRVEVAPGPP